MAKVRLPGDGQEFDIPDTVAASDDLLKQAIVPLYPELASAEIKRETVDGVLTVTMVKRAGTKGATALLVPDAASVLFRLNGADEPPANPAQGDEYSPLATLIGAPPYVHPVLAINWDIMLRQEQGITFTLEEKIALQGEVRSAQAEAEANQTFSRDVMTRLRQATAIAARSVPAGF